MRRLSLVLHAGHDGESGVEAWAPDRLGFATWAADEAGVLAKLPERVREHTAWLARHGLPVPTAPTGFEIVEHARGDEILFAADRRPAEPGEIDEAIAHLAATRAELIAVLDGASDALLDWDPPYAQFVPWADWRTIRANVAHVANGETHYYLKSVGHTPRLPPVAATAGDWRSAIARIRVEAISFLEGLRNADDLLREARIDHGYGAEEWTLRKALRRMVRHEHVHTKSIRRIRRAFEARKPPT